MLGPQRAPGPLSCRQVGRLLQSYLDGELPDARAVLDACLPCDLEAGSYPRLMARLAGLAPRTDDCQFDRLRPSLTHSLTTPPDHDHQC